MNLEIKVKWVEALRSGEYKQGIGKLRSLQDEFCCLGVLCNIIDSDKWIANMYDYTYEDADTEVPTGLRESIQLNFLDQDRLININDTQKRSFSEIADYIQENL